jgi:hypothetical protein
MVEHFKTAGLLGAGDKKVRSLKMKNIFFMAAVAFILVGCSYTVDDIVEHPGTILKDPHYGEYKRKSDALEKQYLDKKISYADYQKKKRELDETYDKEVRERNAIMESTY